MSRLRRPLAAAGAALSALALATGPAWAVTDAELAQLDSAPDNAPGVVDGGSATMGARVIIGLLVVVGLVYVLHRVLRRVQRGRLGAIGGDGGIEVLSTTHLGPNRMLHLVRVGDDVLLLGATDQSISTLHRLPTEDAAEEALPAPLAAPVPIRVADALRDLSATR